MLHRSFKAGKCKTSLKLAVARMKLLKNKRETQVRQLKRELAQLLADGKEQTARIRVEHVVREEKTLAGYDLLEIYCELIVARLPIIESQKNCPIDLKEAISSVVFASPRCADIPELLDVRKHFTAKYGKEFIASALELRPDCGVNHTMVEKFSARAPDGETKIKILTAIAQEHNIDWDPKSLGDNDLKPPEDLLNGPSTFETASKMPVEPPDAQLPPNPGPKYESSTNLSDNNVTRSSLSSHTNASTATTTTPYATMPATFHPEPRASESETEGREFAHPFSKNEGDFSMNRQNWNMEFKDATSAAQAAAESAEQASMAARAAAELSSHGKITRQYSTESHDSSVYGFGNEGPRKSRGPVTEDSVKMVHDLPERSSNVIDPRMRNQQGYRNEQDKLPGVTERIIGGHASIKRRSSHSVYSDSNITSIDDEGSVTSLQKADEYSEKGSRVEAINPSWQTRISDNAHSLGEVSIKEQSSESEEESLIRKHSNRSASSHSRLSTDDDDDVILISDLQKYSNDDGEHSFPSNNQGNMQEGIKQPSSSDFPSIAFDDSGSDDDHRFDVGGVYNEHESNFYFPSPGRNSPSRLSANTKSWNPSENRIESLEKKPSAESHFVTALPSPSKFSEQLTKSGGPSQLDELSPVTFDDSDGLKSQSEDEDNSKLRGRTESSIRSDKQNVFTRSSESTRNDRSHVSTGSSLIKNEVTREDRNPMLHSYDDDSDSEDEYPEGNQERKLNVVGESSEKYGLGDLTTGQPSPKHAKSPRNLDNLGQEPFYSPVVEEEQPLRSSRFSLAREVKAQENTSTPESHDISKNSEFYSSSESTQGLNFGTLKGGLRNKHYRRPPYTRDPSGDVSIVSQKQAVEDTPTIIEQPSASPMIKTSLSSEVRSQESYNENMRIKAHKESSSRTSKTFFDSDSDDDNKELPHQSVGRKSHISSRLSHRTKDSPKTSETGSPLRFKVESEVPVTPGIGMERKSFSRSSHAAETHSKSQSKTISSRSGEDSKLPRTNVQVEQKSINTMPEVKIPVHEESLKLSQSNLAMEQSSNPLPKAVSSGNSGNPKTSGLSGGSASRENSLKKDGHVHPKLPDYDTLAAHFESLRSNRR